MYITNYFNYVFLIEMALKEVCFMMCAFTVVLTMEMGDSCITPNGETARCIPVTKCKIILDAIKTKNPKSAEFARKSQCGYQEQNPLVCCGELAENIVETKCTTPNGESATCLLSSSCNVISDAIKTGNSDALDFAKKSQCHKDVTTVVCCGSEAYPLRTTLLPDRSSCGKQKSDNRIYGGTVTEIWEFPWLALLMYVSGGGKPSDFKCGGSLINSRYVLTAAHCVALRTSEASLDKVRLGEWRISTEMDCEERGLLQVCSDPVVDMKIEEKIVHLEYNRRAGKNDIALLRLERNVIYSDYIQPICLPISESPEPALQTEMYVAGWGRTEEVLNPDEKLKTKVPIVSRDDCNKKITRRGSLSDEQICAGGEPGKDSCAGDSGGPLMSELSMNLFTKPRWYQEGIISWGIGCGVNGTPAVYTRVAVYMDWIIENLKPF